MAESGRTVALVTGAASGIGAVLVRRIAAPGLAIMVHTRRNAAGAERVALAARERGAEAAVVLGDLGETGTGERIVGEAVARFGGLDWLVANAGHADPRPLTEAEPARVRAAFAAMPEAFAAMARAASPHLRASTRGRVVVVSAFGAHRFPTKGRRFAVTGAAKAALEALARALAAELCGAGVTVNCVAPGYVRKDAGVHSSLDPAAWRAIEACIPLGRLAEPREIAAAIAFLLGPEAGYITGQTIHVDGGLSFA